MKHIILLSLMLGLTACDGYEADDPVTRCIAFGHPIDRCIELAKVVYCNPDKE